MRQPLAGPAVVDLRQACTADRNDGRGRQCGRARACDQNHGWGKSAPSCGLMASNSPVSLDPMELRHGPLSLAELRMVLRPFCEKYRIRRLEVFGSVARGLATAGSDVDLLVTLDESRCSPAADLLEMAGEAEELVGAPVDFVLRRSLEKSPNRFARNDILASAVCLYGS
ncbi:MAG: nucleotidyltransferase domain-containing protein [Verrucomicrobiota bacterium]